MSRRPRAKFVLPPLESGFLFRHLANCVVFLAALLAACGPLPFPNDDLPPPVPPQTPEPAARFDFPLPREAFGPYIPHVSGPLPVDTRFGAQNSGLGNDGKCFEDKNGRRVPFGQLFHAGEDWFARDARGLVDGHGAAGAPVRAIANGAVTWEQSIGADGYVLVLAHLLPGGSRVWSAYWHIMRPIIGVGQAVRLGDRLADVLDREYNSHLHWEVRTFGDGTALFSAGSAGGRGTCNGRVPALGYTWDDQAARARPDFWGYRDPIAFVQTHQN